MGIMQCVTNIIPYFKGHHLIRDAPQPTPHPPKKTNKQTNKETKQNTWDVADLSLLNILALFIQNHHEGDPLA